MTTGARRLIRFPELSFSTNVSDHLFAQGEMTYHRSHRCSERVIMRSTVKALRWPEPAATPAPIFEFPADDACVSRKECLLEEAGVFLAEYGENQLFYPIWMAIESVSWDVLYLFGPRKSSRNNDRAGYHDVFARSITIIVLRSFS